MLSQAWKSWWGGGGGGGGGVSTFLLFSFLKKFGVYFPDRVVGISLYTTNISDKRKNNNKSNQ